MSDKSQKGQIYKIVSPDFSKCHVGSTTEGLSRRLARHKASYRYNRKNAKVKGCTCFYLFDEYGIDSCNIYLVEDYSCNSKKELEAREGYHIESTACINRVVAGRDRNEWSKEYRAKNKDKLDEYYKQWKDDNQEHLKEYKANHYQENKEHYKQKGIECREQNKNTNKQWTKYTEKYTRRQPEQKKWNHTIANVVGLFKRPRRQDTKKLKTPEMVTATRA